MAKEKKLTQSEIDGVQYRRAKLWQIILYSCKLDFQDSMIKIFRLKI